MNALLVNVVNGLRLMDARLSTAWAALLTGLDTRLSAAWAARVDAAISSRAAAATAVSNADLTSTRIAKIDQLDATISSRMGGVKSIQRGTVVIAQNGLTGTATLTAVTLGKSILTVLGASIVAADPKGSEHTARLELSNSTTITATRGKVGEALTVGWQVIEFM